MWGIDWSQESTRRGAVWAIGSLIAVAFLVFDNIEKAMAAMTIAGTVAGGLGLARKD
jgi:hypothetical protein